MDRDAATFTAGCTTQACGFRDSYPDFTSSGFDVYCLSADSPSAQSKWQTKVRLHSFESQEISDEVHSFSFVERVAISVDL